jgi:hypothetical protein
MADAPRTLTGPTGTQPDAVRLAAFPIPHALTQWSSVHFAAECSAPVRGLFPHSSLTVIPPGPARWSGRRPVAPTRVERPINLTLRILVL